MSEPDTRLVYASTEQLAELLSLSEEQDIARDSLKDARRGLAQGNREGFSVVFMDHYRRQEKEAKAAIRSLARRKAEVLKLKPREVGL